MLAALLASVSRRPSYAQDPAEPDRLLAPRPAFRVLENAAATLSFVLNFPPDNPVVIEIRDSTGALVAALHPDALQPGLNRIDWDLRWAPPVAVALRTTPPENPHIWEEPRFQGAETRPVAHKGIEQAQLGPLAAPGRYTVELHVDDKTYTQPLDIVLPPTSHGTDADVQASVRLQLKLRDDIASVAAMTNRIEWLRKQIEDQRKLAAPPALDTIDRKLADVEFHLISHSDALSDEKYDSEAMKLYLNFLWLNLSLGSGTGSKYAGGGDYAPTETEISLAHDLETQLHAVQAQYKKLMGGQAQCQHEKGDQQIHRQHGVQFQIPAVGGMRHEIWPKPLRASPQKTEPGLDRRPEARPGGSQFIQEQREIQRPDAPDQCGVLERHCHQLDKKCPIMAHDARDILVQSGQVPQPLPFWQPAGIRRRQEKHCYF